MSMFAKSVVLLSMLTLAWAGKVDLTVTNSLEGKENLKIHCKSRDDDLGMRVLHFNESAHWRFGTDIFWRTMFSCSFQWGKSPFFHFNVYDQIRDYDVCRDCQWFIKKHGPCRDEPTNNAFTPKCYKWN